MHHIILYHILFTNRALDCITIQSLRPFKKKIFRQRVVTPHKVTDHARDRRTSRAPALGRNEAERQDGRTRGANAAASRWRRARVRRGTLARSDAKPREVLALARGASTAAGRRTGQRACGAQAPSTFSSLKRARPLLATLVAVWLFCPRTLFPEKPKYIDTPRSPVFLLHTKMGPKRHLGLLSAAVSTRAPSALLHACVGRWRAMIRMPAWQLWLTI